MKRPLLSRATSLYGPFAGLPWKLEASILIFSIVTFALGLAEAFSLYDGRSRRYLDAHDYPGRGFIFFWTCFLPLIQMIWSSVHLLVYSGKPDFVGRRIQNVRPLYTGIMGLALMHAWIVYVSFLWVTPHYDEDLHYYMCSSAWHERFSPSLGDRPYLPVMTVFGGLTCWLFLAMAIISFAAEAIHKDLKRTGNSIPSLRAPPDTAYLPPPSPFAPPPTTQPPQPATQLQPPPPPHQPPPVAEQLQQPPSLAGHPAYAIPNGTYTPPAETSTPSLPSYTPPAPRRTPTPPQITTTAPPARDPRRHSEFGRREPPPRLDVRPSTITECISPISPTVGTGATLFGEPLASHDPSDNGFTGDGGAYQAEAAEAAAAAAAAREAAQQQQEAHPRRPSGGGVVCRVFYT